MKLHRYKSKINVFIDQKKITTGETLSMAEGGLYYYSEHDCKIQIPVHHSFVENNPDIFEKLKDVNIEDIPEEKVCEKGEHKVFPCCIAFAKQETTTQDNITTSERRRNHEQTNNHLCRNYILPRIIAVYCIYWM